MSVLDALEDQEVNLQMDKDGRRASVKQQAHRRGFVARTWARKSANVSGIPRAMNRADAALRKF